MMFAFRKTSAVCAWILVLSASAVACAADEAQQLERMLHEFLANSDQEAAHVSFWGSDLIYTSSAGERFGKAEILAGFETAEVDDVEATRFTGEDIEIRVHGETAIVAFKLVGSSNDGSDLQYYFNTGTFLKRDGNWQAVAWQATKISDVQP